MADASFLGLESLPAIATDRLLLHSHARRATSVTHKRIRIPHDFSAVLARNHGLFQTFGIADVDAGGGIGRGELQ